VLIVVALAIVSLKKRVSQVQSVRKAPPCEN